MLDIGRYSGLEIFYSLSRKKSTVFIKSTAIKTVYTLVENSGLQGLLPQTFSSKLFHNL